MDYYRQLIALSKWIRRERLFEAGQVKAAVFDSEKRLQITGRNARNILQVHFSFSDQDQRILLDEDITFSEILLDSADSFSLGCERKTALTTAPSGSPLSGRSYVLKAFSALVLRGDS